MSKIRLISVVFLSLLAVPALAQAQDAAEEGPATMFYDFNDMLIDGDLLRPDGMFANERARAQFGSLLSLRRSFIGEIEEAAHEGALQ